MSQLGWQYLSRRDKAAILRSLTGEGPCPGPSHAEIHITDACNLDCFFCATRPTRRGATMSRRLFAESLDALTGMGVRSLGLAGGGEPLAHSHVRVFLKAIARKGVALSYLTTNGVLMTPDIVDLLLACRCELVFVSLNAPSAEDYATMMGDQEETFHRVVANIRNLLAAREAEGTRMPFVSVSFKFYRKNRHDILRMYELGRSLGVDDILFCGLSGLPQEERMASDELEEAMDAFRRILLLDGWTHVGGINSLEQDIGGRLGRLFDDLLLHHPVRTRLRALRRLLRRHDFCFRERVWHALRKLDPTRRLSHLEDTCLMPWHMLVIRPDGQVPACCIQQGRILGSAIRSSLREIWWGAGFDRFRAELRRFLVSEGSPGSIEDPDRTVVPMCALRGTAGCVMRSFYYEHDLPFCIALDRSIRRMRAQGLGSGMRRVCSTSIETP